MAGRGAELRAYDVLHVSDGRRTRCGRRKARKLDPVAPRRIRRGLKIVAGEHWIGIRRPRGA